MAITWSPNGGSLTPIAEPGASKRGVASENVVSKAPKVCRSTALSWGLDFYLPLGSKGPSKKDGLT